LPRLHPTKLRWLAIPLCAALSCATGKSAERDAQVEELRGQLASQGEQIRSQQQRIEALEARLSALASTSRPPPPPPATPAEPPVKIEYDGPTKKLETVKLHPQPTSGRAERRPPRVSPSSSASPAAQPPQLPSSVELKEPDSDALAELDKPPHVDTRMNPAFLADQNFAQAVQQLNSGEYAQAEAQFLSFAARFPRNASADDAIYFAGLARAATGDCKGALAEFDRVLRDYPATNARVESKLEKGRCLLQIGKRAEGRAVLEKMLVEEQGALENQQAKALLERSAN
jgi:TolA-binding protein